ncbi:carbohydrate ABC transporter permease [Cohnella faecalis]|uniref:carbohydrate ABC transporter permease n=1 Tax=Cohnella faecalis TaxID=2315694 RepID=UPI0013142365|nr:sugar ABC transporter permease [Cohnella faecalis]
MVLSTVALVQIFQNVFSVNPVGMLNYFLSWFQPSMLDSEWLSDPHRSLLIVAIAEGYKFAAVYMVIFYSALISISEEVIEAARMDGASGWKLYRYIKLPMIKGIIFTSIILVLNGSLKSFDIPYLLTYGGPALPANWSPPICISKRSAACITGMAARLPCSSPLSVFSWSDSLCKSSK